MDLHTHGWIVAIKTLNLILGGLVTFYAVRAYREHPSTTMWAFSIGFGLITFGALVSGVLDLVFPIGFQQAIVVEGLFVAGGFVAILYSLYV